MAAISYSLAIGQPLENVTAGTLAPASTGTVEIRIDQTSVVTDASAPGGTRPLTKADVLSLLRTLEQQMIRDTNLFQQ